MLTSNSGFSRDRLPGSPVMARFDEKRQTAADLASDENIVQRCGGSSNDVDCLVTQQNFAECFITDVGDPGLLVGCLSETCPGSSGALIQCIVKPIL